MLLSVSDKPPPLDLPWFPCVNKESCVCVLSHFSCVQLCAMLWTVACQAVASVHGILHARTLEWVAIYIDYLLLLNHKERKITTRVYKIVCGRYFFF